MGNNIQVPDLGNIQIAQDITGGMIQAAFDVAKLAPKDIQSLAFSDYLLSKIVTKPPLSPDQIDGLSAAAHDALVNEAVKLLDLIDIYGETLSEADPRERLYRAFLTQIARKFSLALAAYAELPVFDPQILVPAMMENLQTMLAPAQESLQNIMEGMTKHLQQSLHEFGEMASRFTNTVLEQYEKADLDARTAAPMLIRANLWFPPSAPQSLLLAVKDIAESDNPSPEQVESLFLEYYGGNGWSPLRNLCSSWETNPYFTERMPIINAALEAHMQGMYTLSIPALLPQIEGIAGSVMGLPIARKTKKRFYELIEREYPAVFPSAAKDPLLQYISNILYVGMDYSNYDIELESKGIKEDQFLNRPAILHGVNIDYDHVGLSLRAFLLLDALSFM